MVCYYRIALNRGNSILSVAQEMEMVRAYLEIQKFAYESDFRYNIVIGESLENGLMIKNVVQPIVENAFLHGIKRTPRDCISVEVHREEDAVYFTISDNGVGMSKEKTDKIINGEITSIRSGYGLYNIKRRIELYYGEGYGLSVVSEKGVGTTVTLKLKYIVTGQNSAGGRTEAGSLARGSVELKNSDEPDKAFVSSPWFK
jgi:sensor histidine kinase YesM